MRRQFLAVATGAALLLLAPSAVSATNLQAYRISANARAAFVRTWKSARAPQLRPREIVAYEGPYAAGTIVVSTEERRLYFILPGNQAMKYGIGVGRPGFEWAGTTKVSMKREWPSWAPPPKCAAGVPICPALCRGDQTIRSAPAPCI